MGLLTTSDNATSSDRKLDSELLNTFQNSIKQTFGAFSSKSIFSSIDNLADTNSDCDDNPVAVTRMHEATAVENTGEPVIFFTRNPLLDLDSDFIILVTDCCRPLNDTVTT